MDDYDRKFEGVWWLPSAPELRWNGILAWRPTESPRLKLTYLSATTKPPPDSVEAFQGLDGGGAPITVLRADWSGGTRSGLLSTRKYTAGHILRGIHVESLAGFRANRVDFWLEYLGAWFPEEGFADADSMDVWQI